MLWFVWIGGVFLYLLVLWTLRSGHAEKWTRMDVFLRVLSPLFWVLGAFMTPQSGEYA